MNDENHNGTGRSWLDRISQFLTGEPRDRDELVEVLRACHQRGLFGAEALGIIEGAIGIADRQVRDAMTPRAQVVSVRADQLPAEFLPRVVESAHSRFPVFDAEDPDTVLGILLAKDLLAASVAGRLEGFRIGEHLRPSMFVPESRRLDALLRDFRQKRQHMAIVINEYGGVSGLITVEDVLEQVVGEIADEHDEEDFNIRELGKDQWIVRARVPVEEFNGYFGTAFGSSDVDTIGGLVVQVLGRLPQRDEALELGHLRFTVLAADNRQIKLLQVARC